MNEPTEIKYPLDENGEPYYAATHIDAVQGFDTSENEVDLTDINNKITKLETLISEQDKALKLHDATIGDMVGDTGWIDYQVSTANTKNYISSAPPCAIREIRVGNNLNGKWFVVRSIRLNIGKINHNQVIAQLPQGFTNETVSFVLRSSGGKTPIEFSIEKDATVKAYLNGSDSGLWACGEYTWLV